MKKRMFFTISWVFILLFIVGCHSETTSPSSAQQQETYHWRMVHEENNGSIQDVYAKKFKEVLEEKSGGRVTLDIYTVGQIGDATQDCELLQNGAVEFAIISPGNTGTIVPENQLFSLHFLFSEDMDKNKQLFKESVALNKMLSEKYLEKNIRVLSYWTEGTMEWTTSVPVNTPEQWKGIKFRVMPSPMIVASYEAYGANPTPVPYMEVYSALQLNMIEGQENPLSAIEEMKFCEVQKYLTLASSSLYVTTTSVNPDFFNGLSKDMQQIILETVEELQEFSFDTQAELNGGALEKIKAENDIEVITLTKEERKQFKEASQSAYKRYVDGVGPDGEAILNRLMEEVAQIESQ